MSEYVVDANVVIKWHVPEIHEADAARLLAPQNDLYAPDLLAPECGNILWKKVNRKEITEADAKRIAGDLQLMPVTLTFGLDLLPDALKIALDTGCTAYDSMYLALAVSHGCQMVTADKRFYNRLQGTRYAKHLLWVEDVP